MKFELPEPGHEFSEEYKDWLMEKAYQYQIINVLEMYPDIPDFIYHASLEVMNIQRRRDFEMFRAQHPDVPAMVPKPKKRARRVISQKNGRDTRA